MSIGLSHLLIRADCSATIGAGHFLRCMALAHAWMARGGKVTFLSRCESEALRARLERGGIGLIPFHCSHPDPEDLDYTLQVLGRLGSDNPGSQIWTVLDGYHFDAPYQQAIRKANCRVMIIDDMNHLPYYDADVLLNQNMHADTLSYNCTADTVLLLGLKYVLLRPEFLLRPKGLRNHKPIARKVLVTLGGADPDNVTLKVINALRHLDMEDVEVAVVVGPANQHGVLIERALRPFDQRPICRLLHAPDNMAELMNWADMGISAGGTTCWEMSVSGLPFLTLVLADNQRPVAEGLADAGASINLGWHESVTSEYITNRLRELMLSAEIRGRISRCAQSLIDGQGCSRVLNCIGHEALELRRANITDCELLWNWANDPDVRAVSFSSAFIPWENHLRWFDSKLNCSDCILYIATTGNEAPLGQVRYDISQNEAVISICIDKQFRGKGYGPILLWMASQKLFIESTVQEIHAYVKHNNGPSIKAFLKAGFKILEHTAVNDQPAAHLTLVRRTTR